MINILLKTPTFITLFRIGTPHASGLAVVFLMLIGQQPGVAQPNQPSKTYASSYSRGLLSIEKLEEQADSTVERMANPGYVLTDVGIHLNPHSALEVHAQMRIRSEYGGF